MINLMFLACVACFESEKTEIIVPTISESTKESWTCENFQDGKNKSIVKISNYDPSMTKGIINIDLGGNDKMHYHLEKVKTKTEIAILLFPLTRCENIESILITKTQMEPK